MYRRHINLTAQNYGEVLNILEDRFGNKQLIISKHMEQLLKLERVNASTNIKGLRNLYDKVNVHLRSLSSFDVDSDHFGLMLIPVVLEKLPHDIELEMNRRMNKRKWRIGDVLDILKDELEARENCEVSRSNQYSEKSNRLHRNVSGKGFTTEALLTTGNSKGLSPKCAFCYQDLFSDRCTVVTNINAGKEIAKSKKLCFRCLKSYHIIEIVKVKTIATNVNQIDIILQFVNRNYQKTWQRIINISNNRRKIKKKTNKI